MRSRRIRAALPVAVSEAQEEKESGKMSVREVLEKITLTEEAAKKSRLEPTPGFTRAVFTHKIDDSTKRKDVTPKVVDWFFDSAPVRRPARASAAPAGDASPAPSSPTAATALPPPPAPPPTTTGWEEVIADDGYRRVFKFIEERRAINEDELRAVLGSGLRMRAFARSFDVLVQRLPFGVEIRTAGGMKVYAKKD